LRIFFDPDPVFSFSNPCFFLDRLKQTLENQQLEGKLREFSIFVGRPGKSRKKIDVRRILKQWKALSGEPVRGAILAFFGYAV
jgi:hypothetical protein